MESTKEFDFYNKDNKSQCSESVDIAGLDAQGCYDQARAHAEQLLRVWDASSITIFEVWGDGASEQIDTVYAPTDDTRDLAKASAIAGIW